MTSLEYRARHPHRYCRMCLERWPQRKGLCRRCEQNGLIEALWSAHQSAGATVPASVPLTGRRIVVVEGIEYEISWDGSMGGAAARGVPLANERVDDYRPHQGRPPRMRLPHLPGA